MTENSIKPAQERLRSFLRSTFYGNADALCCTIAGLSMALLGRNVDRAFWTIGGGGVGQSLFTSLIHNAMSPMHGFFDCTALYLDDELRKTLEHLIGFKVITAQEGTEGGSSNLRNLRQDLYKKICSADPISCRLPYAKSSKMVCVRGMLRFELNRPLNFANISEANWDSIFRRSLVIEMKGRFFPPEEFDRFPVDKRENIGNFRKDDTLKEFLESGPAALAFIRVLYKYMNDNTIEESVRRLDRYSRREGTTWRIMRESCNLSPHQLIASPDVIDPKATLLRRITELSDALAAEAISNNAEVIKTPSSLGALWKRLAAPNPVDAPQTAGADVANFELMIQEGLWKQHGHTQKGYSVYCPVLRCGGDIGAIYPHLDEGKEPVFPEMVNLNALRRYAESDARWQNSTILRDYGRS